MVDGLDAPTLIRRGAQLTPASSPVVLIHGRGRDPEDMFGLVAPIRDPDVTWLAPTAPGAQWYPQSFLAPVADNQPDLNNSLATIDGIVTDLEEAGHPADQVVLVGFSQGACLVAEYALRHPRRYGGLVVWTGGDISAPDVEGSFEGTPVYIANSDVDDWVPEVRSARTAQLFRRRGAEVAYEVFTGMDHIVNAVEQARMADIVRQVQASRRG